MNQEKMDKDKFNIYFKTITLLVVVILAISIFAWMINYSRSDGLYCTRNPFIWGSQQMVEKHNAESSFCTCTLTGNGKTQKFAFTNTEFNPNGVFNITKPNYDLNYNFSEMFKNSL